MYIIRFIIYLILFAILIAEEASKGFLNHLMAGLGLPFWMRMLFPPFSIYAVFLLWNLKSCEAAKESYSAIRKKSIVFSLLAGMSWCIVPWLVDAHTPFTDAFNKLLAFEIALILSLGAFGWLAARIFWVFVDPKRISGKDPTSNSKNN